MRKKLLEKFVMEVALSEINDSDRRLDRLVQSFVDDSITKQSFGDYALAKSAKRRQEFLKQWREKDAPRVASAPGSIKLGVSPGAKAVRESVLKKLSKTVMVEQQTATPPVPDEPATDQPTTASPAGAPGTPPPPAGTDPNAPATPGVPGGSTPGAVDPTTGAPTDATGAAPAGTTSDLGGGGGGGFSFGGGGGGGGGAGPADTTTPPADGGAGETDTSAAGGGDEEEGGDPVSKIVDDAKELLDQTRDIPTILKSVKAVVQDKFEKPEHALGLIKALYDTGDTTLKGVAVRLYQFIKSGEES